MNDEPLERLITNKKKKKKQKIESSIKNKDIDEDISEFIVKRYINP